MFSLLKSIFLLLAALSISLSLDVLSDKNIGRTPEISGSLISFFNDRSNELEMMLRIRVAHLAVSLAVRFIDTIDVKAQISLQNRWNLLLLHFHRSSRSWR